MENSMTPEELRRRILEWEGPHTDFKRSLGRNIELAKDLVSFANSDGGQLVVGVADDRQVVGVDDVDSLMISVDQVAFQQCSPPVTVIPETVILDGLTVLVLNVPKGDQRPYATSEGKYFVRSGSRCRRASREELLRLFQASQSLFYDEQPLRRLTSADLDQTLFHRYLVDVGLADLDVDDGRLMQSWRLMAGDVPTVAGTVLFGRYPQEALESSRVVLGALATPELGGDFLDRTDASGGLFDVLRQAQAFLAVHVTVEHVVAGFEPERQEDIPAEALREAIVNALVHRDYTIPGAVRIFVYPDRVEVISPGRPPNSVDAEAMRAGAHVPRNPYIYARVAEAQLATRAGSGIRRITRLLRENGGRELGLTITNAQVTLTLPRRRL
jgi:ATP-dependent DNA helicase RecG